MIRYVVVDSHGFIVSYHWTMEDALYHCPKGCCVCEDYYEPDDYDGKDIGSATIDEMRLQNDEIR